ncbi:hypothetical protein MalM25_36890 [Planctomycetes bacterium MalM25]|nr:hypothetical protein MalM25_36890 [Planctomycetes bacterium MalM25]
MFKPPHRVDARRAFTLVELLVVIAIIGILVALLLPAVQAARESARRTQCNNQLKQIGLALQNYHDSQGQFPKGRNSTSEVGVGWSFLILPQMEENAIHDAYDATQPVHAEANAAAMRTPISAYICPSRRSVTADRNFDNNDQGAGANGEPLGVAVAGDYAANAGLEEDMGMENNDYEEGQVDEDSAIDFVHWHADASLVGPIFSNSRIRARHITDGLSKTFAIGEKHVRPRDSDWTDAEAHSKQGDTCFLAADNLKTILRGTEDGLASGPNDDSRRSVTMFGSSHPGVVLFVFADGHTESLSTSRSGFANVNPNQVGDVPDPTDPEDLDEVEQWGWLMAMSTIAGEEIISD